MRHSTGSWSRAVPHSAGSWSSGMPALRMTTNTVQYLFISRRIRNKIRKYFKAWIGGLDGIVWWKNPRGQKSRDTVSFNIGPLHCTYIYSILCSNWIHQSTPRYIYKMIGTFINCCPWLYCGDHLFFCVAPAPDSRKFWLKLQPQWRNSSSQVCCDHYTVGSCKLLKCSLFCQLWMPKSAFVKVPVVMITSEQLVITISTWAVILKQFFKNTISMFVVRHTY
jgi:hypothetical protein